MNAHFTICSPPFKKILFFKLLSILSLICWTCSMQAAVHWTIGNLYRIVDEQSMRPESHDFFTRFDPPYLYEGKIVFRGFNGKKRAGIYTNLNGNLQTVIHNQTKISNNKRFVAFGPNNRPSNQHIPILFKDKIVFFGNGYGNGLTGVYYTDLQSIQPVVTQKNVIPNGAKGLFTNFIDSGFLDEQNIIVIGEGKNNISGIYRTNLQQKIIPLVQNDRFQKFLKLGLPRNGRSDRFVFLGMDKEKRLKMYSYRQGTLEFIMGSNTEIPKGAGFFKSIENILYDDKTDQVFFIGRGILGQVGLYGHSKGKIYTIADQHTVIPEEDDRFKEIDAASIDNGLIVFHATGHNNQEGIYLYTKNSLFKILTNRDTIDKKAIKKINLGPGGLHKNQIALQLEREDGQSIYICDLEMVD